jgi:hypothetical protein
MRKWYWVFIFIAMLVLIWIGYPRPQNVQAEHSRMLAVPTSLYPEYWKSGITLEGTSVFSNVAGRLLSDAASVRTDWNANIYYVFPAPGSAKTVADARYHILQRTGSYANNVVMSLKVYTLAGTYQRTVTNAYYIKTASTGTWIVMTLSADPDNLVINPGEYLAAHFNMDGGATGNMNLQVMFDITLR